MKIIDFQEKEIKLVLDFCETVGDCNICPFDKTGLCGICLNEKVTKQLMESLKKEFDINILKEKLKEVRNE